MASRNRIAKPLVLTGAALLSLGAVPLLVSPLSQAKPRGTQAYRILVTNDDGIDAAGLKALTSELSRVGQVSVSAPLHNRSGSSHSIEISRRPSFAVREVSLEGAAAAVAVEGTPADSVRFGLLVLGKERPFDLVVSGINGGSNVGKVAHYSGTVGAAMEALYHGVPAIAVSQDVAASDYSLAARLTARLVAELKERGAPSGVVLSINVPAAAIRNLKDVVVAPMGGSYFAVSGFSRVSGTGAEGQWRANSRFLRQAPPGTDTDSYFKGRITVTPLRFDWTDRLLLEELDWVSAIGEGLEPR